MNETPLEPDIEEIRLKFKGYVDRCGGKIKASEVLKSLSYGVGIDKSTVGRIYSGQGKPALIAMATMLLELHFDGVDGNGDSE